MVNTSTAASNSEQQSSEVRLPEHQVGEYHGDIIHTFGEGYNREYSDYMDNASRASINHDNSIQRRKMVNDFDQQIGNEWWKSKDKIADVFKILSSDLVKAVEITCGHFDRQKAAVHIARTHIRNLESIQPAITETLKAINTIFSGDPLAILQKINEHVKKENIEATGKAIISDPSQFGALKGIEVDKDTELPKEFTASYVDSNLRDLLLRHNRSSAYKGGKVDTNRADCLNKLFMWTLDRNFTIPPCFYEDWPYIAPMIEEYLKDPIGSIGKVTRELFAAKALLEQIETNNREHPCNSIFVSAVVHAMENTSLKAAVDSDIPEEIQQTAKWICRNTTAENKLSKRKRPN